MTTATAHSEKKYGSHHHSVLITYASEYRGFIAPSLTEPTQFNEVTINFFVQAPEVIRIVQGVDVYFMP